MTREQELDSVRRLIEQLEQLQAGEHVDAEAVARLSDDIMSLQTNILLNDLFGDE